MHSLRKKTVATAVGLAVVISACKSASVGASNPSTKPASATAIHSLPFDVLHNGISSGYTKLSEFVIQDGDEFTRRWRGVLQGSPDAEKPEVNFEKTTVVFVAIGARNTGGYSVHVDSISKESTGATVHYTVTSPGSRCMSMQMLTSPVEVISFDRVEGQIKFRKRGVSGAC
ncbi:MAG: protease complex subunit PrcB family protein [Gemmatimonadaceae bacterium]